jgi:hypothetical protein
MVDRVGEEFDEPAFLEPVDGEADGRLAEAQVVGELGLADRSELLPVPRSR